MTEIIEIDFQKTFEVRHPVLRQGKPIETCYFEGDELETTTHFGFFNDENLTGVLSVYQKNNATFNAAKPFQIRGMAVLESFQKKGIGELLIKHCEAYVAQQEGDIIWFNAREMAVGFYERLHYVKLGDAFIIPDVGIHYLMFKNFGGAYE